MTAVMVCAHCHTPLSEPRFGFTVCPHCQYVNVPAAAPVQAFIAKEYKAERRLVRRLRKKHLFMPFSIGLVALLFLITMIGLNIWAASGVTQAKQLDAVGRYSAASSRLSGLPAILVLPLTRHEIKDEKLRNATWLSYDAKLAEANKLIAAQHYPQALTLLRGISVNFPTYSRVAQAITKAESSQIATSSQTATSPAPSQPQTTPTSTANTTHPQAQQPTTVASPPPNPIITTSLCKVDASLATDLINVAQNIATTCQTNFPKIEGILGPTVFPAPHTITLTNTTYSIAYTVGNTVTVQIAYLRSQPGDMGMIVHELAHVVQDYPSGPGWITEGVADYVRYTLGYSTSWSYFHCDSTSNYLSGYDCSATFLRFVKNHYDPAIISQVNSAMRSGTYSDNLFVSKTGKTVSQLYAQCLLSDCSGGKPA